MPPIHAMLVRKVIYYNTLLYRYARRIIKDEKAAEKLTFDVIEAQYRIDLLTGSKRLRMLLKTDMRNRCIYHQQAGIFDQLPMKIKLVRQLINNKKNQS